MEKEDEKGERGGGGLVGCLRGPVEKVERGRGEGEINKKKEKGRNARGGRKKGGTSREERRKQNGIAA